MLREGLEFGTEIRSDCQPLNGLVAAMLDVIGYWLEFYDVLVFTFFAMIIADAFFPVHDRQAQSAWGSLIRSVMR